MVLHGLKHDFPWYFRTVGRKNIYCDSAATTHKPKKVLYTLRYLYEKYNAAVNRSNYAGGEKLTEMYLDAHRSIMRFIGANDPLQIVFTGNCTHSINLVAISMLRAKEFPLALRPGDRIITSILEHHSNMVPWQELAKATGAEIVYAQTTDEGIIDIEHFKSLINGRTRIAAFSHASNVLGTINPVKELTDICRKAGVLTLIDGTQAVPHIPVNVSDIGCDFYAFSGHKMLGPTGVGVLYGRTELLKIMTPAMFGGGMIQDVDTSGATWNELPWKFIAGTPDACGAIALAGADDPDTGEHLYGAVDYLKDIGMENVRLHEEELVSKTINLLHDIKGICIPGTHDVTKRTGIVSFNIEKNGETADSHTVGNLLSQAGFALRTGGHCAYPFMRRLGIEGTVRASFYIYNDLDDVKKLCNAVSKISKIIL